ncbi:hypothetical protein Tco_0577807, partial [Tanacetum coccineum]
MESRGEKGILRNEAMHRGTANVNCTKTKRGTDKVPLRNQRSGQCSPNKRKEIHNKCQAISNKCPRGKWKVKEDGEVRVMTRGFRDLVANLGDKVVMEVLVRCWSDGDMVVRSWRSLRIKVVVSHGGA